MRGLARLAIVLAVLTAASLATAADVDGDVAGPLPIDAFTRIETGMGEQQVTALVGVPSAVGPYRPLLSRVMSVVGLGATYRTSFYRGMGRVLFEGGAQLVQNGTVVKVEIDRDEPGNAHELNVAR